MNKIEVDVVILGGGTSGVAAAIQAARAGVSVMVVEETKWLGGMLTSAAVSAIDGNYHLPSGIWGEFRQRLIDYYGDSEALKTGWVSHVQFEPHIGQQLLAEMISEYSSIKTMFGYYLKKVTADDRKIVDILISNETETVRVRAEIFIDADEYGDLVKQSNCRYYSGRDSREITGETNAPEIADGFIQDLTWVAILKDFGPGTDRIIPKPDNYKPEIYHGCHENLGSGMEAVQKML
ncbi:MAG: FAD-dependent oxidoreductase, partial [Candidatus Marinimicrobia bacterium]|nr:FAD-dependent oxidoreductase [Candidatus Neomarinimicrobiota bacterium]